MSCDELIVVVRRQAGLPVAPDRQISEMAGRLAGLMEAGEALVGRLAKVEHLLSRNSGNSSSPPSKDDDPGRTPPPENKHKRGKGGSTRSRGKQRGAAGSHLPWTESPDDRQERFPEGRCECGADLGAARDLGIAD